MTTPDDIPEEPALLDDDSEAEPFSRIPEPLREDDPGEQPQPGQQREPWPPPSFGPGI